MNEKYVRDDLMVFATDSEIPRREFDLIEFYKKVKQKFDIMMVEFDEENHIVMFHGMKKHE